MKQIALAAIIALFVISVLFITPPAMAVPTTQITLYDGEGNLLGTPESPPVIIVPSGTNLNVTFSTDANNVHGLFFLWINPSGHTQRTLYYPSDIAITSYNDSYVPNEPGEWTVRIIAFDYRADAPDAANPIFSGDITFTYQSLFVIPESPFGTIALVASALVASSVFIVIRKRKVSVE